MIQLLSTLPMKYLMLAVLGIVLIIGFCYKLIEIGRRKPDYGEYKTPK
jgi:hypothetical protein